MVFDIKNQEIEMHKNTKQLKAFKHRSSENKSDTDGKWSEKNGYYEKCKKRKEAAHMRLYRESSSL